MEILQLTQQEPQMNVKASVLSRKSEETLKSQLDQQKSIVEQRDPRKKPHTDRSGGGGFFAFLKCCMSPKASNRGHPDAANPQRNPTLSKAKTSMGS